MIAKRKSIVSVSILLGSPGLCFCFFLLLGAMIVPTAQALSSLSSSSSGGGSSPSSSASAAASMSPLFRTCPPPQGPEDQQVHQHQHAVLGGGGGGSVGMVSEHTKNPASNSNNAQQQKQYNKVNVKALQALGYPEGFCRALVHGATRRVYWIVDDSLSMSTKDGHFLLNTPDGIEQALCTRWDELRETVLQHALLALHLDIPTDFRLLNHAAGHFRIPRYFGAAHYHSHPRNLMTMMMNHNTSSASDKSLADVQHAQKILSRTKPRGVTPLTERLGMVHKELKQSVLPKLPVGQNVALVLATDGLPTHAADHGKSTDQAKQDFRQALLALPVDQVSVVIRLCTDDDEVVSFYNQLQTTLPHVQVLDDYWAEAARVQAQNPWLNYGLVLHRLREMACCAHYLPLLKVLSQRPLTVPEMTEFCAFLFDWSRNDNVDEIPSTWEGLVKAVHESNAKLDPVWNPISAQLEAWVDLEKYRVMV